MIVVGAISLIAWACDAYTKRHRVNRRVRKARRWPTDGNTHRSYWSGCKRVSMD